jgi:hypothetical protein
MTSGTYQLEPPDVPQQFLFREHPSWLRSKCVQQGELLRGQIHLLVAEHDLSPDGIDPQLADLKNALRAPFPRTPQDGGDSGRELLVVKRLAFYVGFTDALRAGSGACRWRCVGPAFVAADSLPRVRTGAPATHAARAPGRRRFGSARLPRRAAGAPSAARPTESRPTTFNRSPKVATGTSRTSRYVVSITLSRTARCSS